MCGITGIFSPGRDAARLAYFGLYALQHRGQESAGIAAADGGTIRSHKDMGLIGAIFDEESLAALGGHIAVGHTRYSTTGSSIVVNAQPLLERTELGDFAFAHNGNLTNTDEMRASLSPSTTLQATSDSEVMAKTLVEARGSMLERIRHVLSVARGAYSIVLSTEDELYAFRDPWGVRPMCIGTFADGGYAVASESCALPTIGAQYLREIEAGEIVRITANGLESFKTPTENARPALCMFEYIYFARPDSRLNGRSIYMARYAMGRQLAKEHPVDADVVMAIPDSAVPGGIGYAAESGLPYVEGLIKNRYIGRTFISPDQGMRSRGVQLKFNPVVENLKNQRVVVVDDSIVRGHDDAAHRLVTARSRRERSSPSHHVAADQASVLPRRRHGDVRRTHCGELHDRRNPPKNRCRFARLPQSRRAHRSQRTQRRRNVPGLPHRRLSQRARGA